MSLRQEQIERELHLAKQYWQQTIQPYITKRKLFGIELYLAEDAYRRLQEAKRQAEEWNSAEDGRHKRIATETLLELEGEEFKGPEVLYADEKLKPENLAMIAAPLLHSPESTISPHEAVRIAHELLLAAENYICTLPKEQPTIKTDLHLAFSTLVTFAEIQASNREDSRRLPLLPTVQKKRNAGRLSLTAFRNAVKKHLEKHSLHLTKEKWTKETRNDVELAKKGRLVMLGSEAGALALQENQRREREYLNDCLKNGHIMLHDLCELRWERFKTLWEQQKERAIHRNPSKIKRKRQTR